MNPFEEMWATLGIAPTADKQELRRAYTRKLKVTNPEDDPEAFKKLREAYEFALQFGEYEFAREADERPAAVTEPAAEQMPVSENAPASAPDETRMEVPPQPVRPADPAGMRLESALDALAHELRPDGEPDLGKARSSLEKMLDPAILERLDLLQRADESLAELLATSVPRSDPLLDFANERLEWSQRLTDNSLSPFARRVIGRISDLAYSDELKSGNGDASHAWRRLAEPPNPALRWVHAFVLHHASWPELTLIHNLEEEHPELLAGLNTDNVRWWLRFEGRPRISAWTVGMWLILSVIAGVIGLSAGGSPPNFAGMYAGFFGAAFGFLLLGLFRIYAIEWPIILSRRHWGYRLPTWLSYGWITAAVSLLFLGLLTRGTWLAWPIAVAALLTVWWATIAAGPVQPMVQYESGALAVRKSRLLRMVVFNAFAALWLFLVAGKMGEQFGTPLIVTIAAVLCASGVARDLQVSGFATELPPHSQKLACHLMIGAAFVVGFLALMNSANAAWHPAILVAVLACTVLRRAAPVDLEMPTWVYRFGWFFVIVLINIGRHVSDSLNRGARGTFESDASGLIIVGSLVFLGGVLVAAFRFLGDLRKNSPEAADLS